MESKWTEQDGNYSRTVGIWKITLSEDPSIPDKWNLSSKPPMVHGVLGRRSQVTPQEAMEMAEDRIQRTLKDALEDL